MVKYRRYLSDNYDDIYFITIVVKDRQKIFQENEDYESILRCLNNTMNKENGNIEAFVLMPDHIHLLIKQGNIQFSKRVHSFKLKSNHAIHGKQKSVWQLRYWEHRIRDDEDYRNHVDYIHYNPVKHGYVDSPYKWEYSSFNQFVQEGLYEKDWSSSNVILVGGDL